MKTFIKREALLFCFLVVFRVFNALCISTFFQPDEYWQSLEPAHKLVYGYGWLTWEWKEHLRSAAHPLLFALIYKLGNFLGIDPVIGPKVFQGIIAAIGDYFTYKTGTLFVHADGGAYCLLITMFSAFNWYVSVRTFSNSLETSLMAIAYYVWPWKTQLGPFPTRRIAFSLFIGSLACIFRPTNALLWLFMGVRMVLQVPNHARKIYLIVAVIASISLGINGVADYLYFGEPVFPIFKFLKFNLLQSLSHFYGVSPFHYYLSQGLPLLLIGYLPLAINELISSEASVLAHLVCFILFAYSLMGHKEVRFIFPILPVLHVLVARSLMRWDSPSRKKIFALMISINIPVAIFFSQFHQRGVISVVDYVRKNDDISSLGFLMPCHSTPWQSHMHRNDMDVWFLTCEPPLGLSKEERETYLDEADVFYEDPLNYLAKYVGNSSRPWPSHLSFFEALLPDVEEELKKQGYSEVVRFFNSYFHDDWRRKGDVLVWKKQ